MIFDVPSSCAKAVLALEDCSRFVDRYMGAVLRVVAITHDAAERLKSDNKETRDGVLGMLLKDVNEIICGKTPEDFKPWPGLQLNPVQVGLGYRSQLVYLLTVDNIAVRHILNFINVVYFPALNLSELNEAILRSGISPHQNSQRTQTLILSLSYQFTKLATGNDLVLPTEEVV